MLRYMNGVTNFRGLPLRVEMVPFSLIHMYSLIHVEANVSSHRDSIWLVYLQETRDHLCNLYLL